MLAMRKADFDAVRKAAQGLAGVEESTYFGQPALKMGGEMVACLASHKSAEPGSLVVKIAIARREELLAEAPDVYYLTDHYVTYPSVLVRLSKVSPDALRGLLSGAIEFTRRASSGRKRPGSRAR
jgi:hypothetical protein